MLHRTSTGILRRPCAGWYQTLANNYHHASKGRSMSHVLRPWLKQQSPKRRPDWLTLTRSLQGLSSRCYASMDSTEMPTEAADFATESEENVGVAWKTQSNESPSSIELEQYEDQRLRQLYLRLTSDFISRTDIYAMSSDIQKVQLLQPEHSVQSTWAFLTFASKDLAQKNLDYLSKRDDVKYVAFRRTEAPDNQRSALKLIAFFPKSAPKSKEDITALSEDIKRVDLHETKGMAVLHFHSQEGKSRAYKAIKRNKNDIAIRMPRENPAVQVNLYQLKDGFKTVNDIMAFSDDILDARLSKVGQAYLDFASEELAVKTMKLLRREHNLSSRIISQTDRTDEKAQALQDRRSWNLFTSLQKDETAEQLCSLSNNIIDCRIGQKGDHRFAHLDVASEKLAIQTVRELNEKFPGRFRLGMQRDKSENDRKVNLGRIKSGFTTKQILGLSDYIVDAWQNRSNEDSSHVCVTFSSAERAIEQYKRWLSRNLPCTRIETQSAYQAKRLRIDSLNFDVTERDIASLSKDILKVVIVEAEDNRHAYLEFESPEVKRTNYYHLKGSLGDALFYLGGAKEKTLFLKHLKEDETEESLMSSFDDLPIVTIRDTGIGERLACLHFATKEASTTAFMTLMKEKRHVHWQNQSHEAESARKVCAKLIDPTLTKEDIMDISGDICRVDKNGSNLCIHFASKELLEKNFKSLTTPSIAERLNVFPETVEGGRLWVGGVGVYSQEQLEADLETPNSVCVDVKEREDGMKYAFLNCASKEVAEQNREALQSKGYSVDTATQQVFSPSNRTLKLYFPGPAMTEEEVKQLSTDITKVHPISAAGTEHTFTKVEFKNSSTLDDNFQALTKLGMEKGFKVHYIGIKYKEYQKDLLPRSVNMRFPNLEVSEADIQELSFDVEDMHLYRERNYTYATVVFRTKEAAEANLSEFERMGLEAKPRQPFRLGGGIAENRDRRL